MYYIIQKITKSFCSFRRNLLCIAVLVQRGELDEGCFGKDIVPFVKADDDAVRHEHEIMVRLLQGLGDRVKLTFVRARIVRLRLARYRAHEVGVDSHGETEHVHCLLNVCAPVTALLLRINLIDADVPLFLAIGCHVVG